MSEKRWNASSLRLPELFTSPSLRAADWILNQPHGMSAEDSCRCFALVLWSREHDPNQAYRRMSS